MIATTKTINIKLSYYIPVSYFVIKLLVELKLKLAGDLE